ncbi:MAG: hypothetical protein ACTHL1_07380 [Burkholderiaceae bacterium]
MKRFHPATTAIAALAALTIPASAPAFAQQPAAAAELPTLSDAPPVVVRASRLRAFPGLRIESGGSLLKRLEERGIVDRSLHGPYRIGLPLMMSDDNSSKLVLSYAPHMPDSGARNVILLYARFHID